MNEKKMDNADLTNDFVFKICVIGEGTVGKTSLIKRYTQGSFVKEYIKTLGGQFSQYETIIGTQRIRLFFWDIAGQNEFNFMRPTFYKGAKAAIIVYDLSKPETEATVETWYNDSKQHTGTIPVIVFGNKIDLVDVQKLDQTSIEDICKKHTFLGYYLTSAATGEHVKDAFHSIINILVENALHKIV
jgi:small GTP-binding protein